MSAESLLHLAYLGLLAASLTGWAVIEFRKGPARSLKMALAWLMIVLGALALYGLWGDITRGMKPRQTTGAATVTLPRAADGHYYAQVTIGGAEVTFMVDTGASDVVLSPQDARKAGLDPAGLVYVGQAMTANGMVRTARVRLDSVAFGPFQDTAVPASVNQAPMDISLLGMSYLGQFQISIAGDEMVLRR
jgi:aspartyl protease family protein